METPWRRALNNPDYPCDNCQGTTFKHPCLMHFFLDSASLCFFFPLTQRPLAFRHPPVAVLVLFSPFRPSNGVLPPHPCAETFRYWRTQLSTWTHMTSPQYTTPIFWWLGPSRDVLSIMTFLCSSLFLPRKLTDRALDYLLLPRPNNVRPVLPTHGHAVFGGNLLPPQFKPDLAHDLIRPTCLFHNNPWPGVVRCACAT